MNKIQKFLAGIPNDKLLRFFYGWMIATPLLLFFEHIVVLAIMLVIGLTKEFIDDIYRDADLSFSDTTYTVLPIVTMTIIEYIK